MPVDQRPVLLSVGPSPAEWEVDGGTQVDLVSVFAHFDGTAAAGAFRPAVTIRAQNGTILSRTFPGTELAAGDVADVTYAPFLRRVAPAAVASYDDLILAEPSLLWYYECGEAGGNLVDSQSGLDMAPVGAPVYGAAGPIPPATAVSLNGTANYWSVVNANADLAFGFVHAFTIEGFLYLINDGSINNPLFSFHLGATQYDLGCSFATKRLSLQRGGTQTPVSALQNVPTAVWNYVAGTYDGANLRCYLNGAQVGGPTATVTNHGSLAGGTQAIGARGTPAFSTYLSGRAANVAIYSTALSGATIALHYLRWQGLA